MELNTKAERTSLLQEKLVLLVEGLDPSKAMVKPILKDLRIRTKERTIETLRPNPIQKMYLDYLRLTEDGLNPDGSPMRGKREIVLKARQFGFSTLILALIFLDTYNNPNTQSVIIAQDKPNTEKLFQIIKRYYDNLPPMMKRKLGTDSKSEMFWPDIESGIWVATAGSKKVGRGGTINNVHASEVAFWADADAIMGGLMQAVPMSGNIFMETTANGIGNWFYEEFTAAEEGRSTFKPQFFPWWKHPEYQADVLTDGKKFEPTDEELRLIDQYGLTEKQLIWRRNKILELKGLFPQEYPANAQEAFLVSGSMYFDTAAVDAAMGQCQDPIPFDELRIPARFSDCRVKGLQVWKMPQAGKHYVVGADPAEGIRDSGEHDFCSADVVEVETWEQVAHLHGKWDTHEFGLILAALGRWYNEALICVERNNHGHSVLNTLIHTAGYPLMDPHEPHGVYLHADYDERKRLRNRRPGFPASGKSKIFYLNLLATVLEEGTLKFRNRDTLREMRTYAKFPGGGFGAEGKAHDDRVTSIALAVVCLNMKFRAKKQAQTKISSGTVRRGGYV